jgi:hypothetical protein
MRDSRYAERDAEERLWAGAGSLMKRMTLLKYLVAASAGAALEWGVAFAQMPERVVAMCGGGSVPWESLCNVDAGLHEAFRWIERIGGSEELLLRNRLSAMIRDRHVAIDWHPNHDLPAIHPGLLGLFDKTSGRVYVPQALRSQPERVKAAILAHEPTHAAWQVATRRGLSSMRRAPAWSTRRGPTRSVWCSTPGSLR